MGQSNVPIQSGAFVIGPLTTEDAGALIERIALVVAGPAAVENILAAVYRPYSTMVRAMLPGVTMSTPVGDLSATPTASAKAQPKFPYDIFLAPDGEGLARVIVLPRDGADPERLRELLNEAVKAPTVEAPLPHLPSIADIWKQWATWPK